MIKKFFILICATIFCTINSFAQSYNQQRTTLANFLVRMYENEPFDGVKVVEDYDNAYLMSVVVLDKAKYKTSSQMNRVASVKAMSQASRFFNGSKITDDLVIRTTEKADGTVDTETIENINEHSMGYVKALELLRNFPDQSGSEVYIFIAPIKQE